MSKIVVGVDASEGSRAALRWAHQEAGLRRCPLVVVTVWQYPVLTTLPAFGALPPIEDLSQEAEAALRQVLDEEGVAATDDVEIETVVAEGAAAAALLEAADGADLLVVGSRGHGGFTGMLLGSVSQHVVSHAPCPVVVVRH
ncbi:universal stress protein [Rhabdothermincola salaria]|uniref:universal stress protein n=1 Tax=Rhabdothermincola salaria TaxID=2903142 RepID=UPI001E360A86|nr:universal stress protein [Rhabdothermincola salaria]MCD9625377.1 universal stress protein [Rhabdothermincola salaria]